MDTNAATNGSYSSPKDIGLSDADVVKRWTLELSLATKTQKKWMDQGVKIFDIYRTEKSLKNTFNILWPNTETLTQAIYNTLPKPDIRRRYRDADPVGKVVSDVLERAVDYSMDCYDFDSVLKMALLDMLLPGRGISRVRYVPDFEDVEDDKSQEDESAETEKEDAEPMQKIAYERVICEHVDWQDFRHGPGKTWEEVRWIAFRHRMSQEAGVEMFGDVFLKVSLETVNDDDVKKQAGNVSSLFKTAEVWEIHDKDNKKIFFVAPSYKYKPLLVSDDELGLDGFFPIPRPLYAILDSGSLLPAPLYEKYRQQAEELNRISSRINNLTEALKSRGVFNAVLKEIEKINELGDNQMVAATNVQMLSESGGLEKNIWMMPIERAANVIAILNQQRDAAKAVIYEITGIADIMRGATDSNETYGAQKIKTQWGTQRLKKMQAEFARYVRDIVRLKVQIIANKFQIETIKEMTGVKLIDTDAEKQMLKQQLQAQQAMQQQAAQQAPQPQGAPQ